jgi:FixJ family two-component response regulator
MARDYAIYPPAQPAGAPGEECLATTHMSRTGPPLEDEPVVLIVEDDPLVRAAMESLFHSAGLASRAFATAREVLEAPLPSGVCCFVLDVRLPQISGFDLQAELARRGQDIPIVFVTGHGDIPMSVRAMKAGAVDFLPKPFRDQDMLDAVTAALARDRTRREGDASVSALRTRFATLTPREREVMELVVSGLLNKQAAAQLGLSEITVKLHRSNMMRKMEARTLAGLVHMAEALSRGTSPS